jgi:integrase
MRSVSIIPPTHFAVRILDRSSLPTVLDRFMPPAAATSESLLRLLQQAINLATGDRPDQVTGQVTVESICTSFLSFSKRHHGNDCFTNYKHFIDRFVAAHGSILAAELKPFHVTKWLDDNPTWKGGRRHAVIAVKRAFSWADEEGLFGPSPVRKLKVPRVKKRKRVLGHDELQEILSAIRDLAFRQFMQALLETGCRPSEVARVTAAEVRLELGLWVFDEHKTEEKTQRARVIYLTPAIVELTRKLMQLHPAGPLFRGCRGQGFTRNAIRCRFKRMRAKLPHLKHFVSYNIRHTYATNALVNGVDVAHVAELLGHVDPSMVLSTYGHLAEKTAHMREVAKKAIGQ